MNNKKVQKEIEHTETEKDTVEEIDENRSK